MLMFQLGSKSHQFYEAQTTNLEESGKVAVEKSPLCSE